MSRLAVCEAPISHGEYRGFQLFEFEEQYYGVPADLVHIPRVEIERAFDHPAVVVSRSREGLEVLIDSFDPTPFRREQVGEFEDCDIIRHGETFYGIPRRLGLVDPNLEKDRTRNGVVTGDSPEEVIERIRDSRTAYPVEFAGWLPVFDRFGNCGSHPQFAHTQAPPPGYRFTNSRPVDDDALARAKPGLATRIGKLIAAVAISAYMFVRTCRDCGLGRTVVTLFLCVGLVLRLVRKTGLVMPTLRFVHTRNFHSQVLAPRNNGLVFITSVPYTYGQSPWVIEVEDSTSLFFPFILNGKTCTGDVTTSPYFTLVKTMLESDSCRGILTHMRSTAETLPTLFKSEVIAKKVSYAPLGVKLPRKFQTHDEADDDTINLLFTNSWHQNTGGFYLRGGLDVIEAFWILHARYPQVRLTLRSSIPSLDKRYMKIIQDGWVRVIDKFTPAKRMDELQRESHIYLLPAARIHIVSVLQAMSYGQAVVVSDGWGMDEYVSDGVTGLMVKGRAGKVSWMDREAGLLREDYRPMYSPDPQVVEGLVEAVSRLIEERSLRKRLGRAARKEVETKYTMAHWNAALAAAFDKARSGL